MEYKPEDLVKSCPKLESGLRLGIEGVRACQLGPFASPLFWSAEEASGLVITKAMIVEKRRELFQRLNAGEQDIACAHCHMVNEKHYEDVQFTRLGRIDHAPTTICNLRCSFCGNTTNNTFGECKYDAMGILRQFEPEDVEWDSIVDFNGGEPTLLSDFKEYLDYFASRRIRVLLYTNGVKYSQAIYDGLANGSLFWVCTSLDSGTPSTYQRLKKSNAYAQVLENLTRYAHAGSQGGGQLAAKYIFCEENCGEDDISGFVYAMLAIRPQRVWLTYDFTAFGDLAPEDPGPDYSRQIAAYVEVYSRLKKHGVAATHYTEGHLALICSQGKTLLQNTLDAIERAEAPADPALLLGDFRQRAAAPVPANVATFILNPLRYKPTNDEMKPWSLTGKRILLVPASPKAASLLDDPEIKGSQLLGFVDRNRTLHGKTIHGLPVYDYDAIAQLKADVILVAAPAQHHSDILQQVIRNAGPDACITTLGQ